MGGNGSKDDRQTFWKTTQKPTAAEASWNIPTLERNLTESPCDGEESVSTRHLIPPSKASTARKGLSLVELLVEGVHGSPKPHRLLLRLLFTLSDCWEGPITEDTSCLTHQTWGNGSSVWPEASLAQASIVLLEGKESLMSPRLKRLWPSQATCLQDILAQMLIGVNNHILKLDSKPIQWDWTHGRHF